MIAFLLTAYIQSQFAFDVKVLDSIEGGPIVINASVAFVGKKPLRVWMDYPTDPFQVTIDEKCPVVYREKQPQIFYSGFGSDYRMLTGHFKESKRIPVHRLCVGVIPRGPLNLTVLYNLWIPRGKQHGFFQVALKKTVTIDVKPFNRETATGMHKVIRRGLEAPIQAATDERKRVIFLDEQADRIIGTSHEELLPSAIEILKATTQQSVRLPMRNHILRFEPGRRKLYGLDAEKFLSSAMSQNELNDVFFEWRQREMFAVENLEATLKQIHLIVSMPIRRPRDGRPIIPEFTDEFVSRLGQQVPDDILAKLLSARSVWLRGFVYITFSGRIPGDWKSSFLSDLKTYVAPLPLREVNRRVQQLSSDLFQEREAASKWLLENYEHADLEIVEATKSSSREVSRRAILIQTKHDNRTRNSDERAFLSWLQVAPATPSRDRVLKILRNGDGKMRCVKEAKSMKLLGSN